MCLWINCLNLGFQSFPVTLETDNASIRRVSQELPWLMRSVGDKEGLIRVLTDITIFSRLFV